MYTVHANREIMIRLRIGAVLSDSSLFAQGIKCIVSLVTQLTVPSYENSTEVGVSPFEDLNRAKKNVLDRIRKTLKPRPK